LSPRLVGEGGTVAIRVPAHPVARALALAFDNCVTATSANISGQAPALTAQEVLTALGERVDAVVDTGSAPGGSPSTIVRITADGPQLIRAGAIAWERVLESLE
jgi:L-threonylcarbamoyladenylate synthase